MEEKKALVLYSGGLDSRLAICLLKEQGFDVTALYFNLPYGCGCCNLSCNFNFTQRQSVPIKIFDVTKEPHLSEYLNLIKNPKYGTGSGINPCKDCKIYIFKKAAEFAKKKGIRVIATGEVLGQRPMSQTKSAMKIIDKEIGFEILRPLSAKLLPETEAEKKGIVDRSKLLAIKGRGRKKQIALAKKFGIEFPSPGGGCFLCEKEPSGRLLTLLKHSFINEKTLPLSIIGRHFLINGVWFVVSRNAKESGIIEGFGTSLKGGKGTPAVYFSDISGEETASQLQKAFSKSSKEKDKFSRFKI